MDTVFSRASGGMKSDELPFPQTSRSRHWYWLPWLVWSTACGLTAAAVVLLFLSRHVSLGPRWGPRGFPILLAVMFSMMGLLVTTRRPHHLVGRLYLTAGLLCGLQAFGEEYAAYALLAHPGRLPGGIWWAWLQHWIWVPVVSLYLIYIPLLLPEGRWLSPRWRRVGWFAALATAVLSFFFATQPGPLANFRPVVNPLGVSGPPALWSGMVRVGFGLMLLATIASVSSLGLRLRRAGAVERQQLKWVAFACGWGAAGMLASLVFGMYTLPSVLLVLGGIFGMHAATALAILRYRLYDIDVIIRRTLVYGLLSTALTALYFGCVGVLQSLAVGLTGQRQAELVTVLVTLGMAALAAPLRVRLQRGIDRRFYRTKYDAARSLEQFGRMVQGEGHADLACLSEDILGIVHETLQPASASLWVRPRSDKKI